MSQSNLEQVIEEYHRTLDAFVKGDPEPTKKLWSRRDDVTLANPFGLPARGWDRVEETMERAASLIREGEFTSYERISGYSTADLGYNVEIQRTRAKVGGSDEITPISLRVTTVFRREDGEWRIVHRHADPITAPMPMESIAEK